MRRFVRAVGRTSAVAVCLDLEETPLSRAIRETMRAEFPELPYVYATDRFAGLARKDVRVPRDFHPNAWAHEFFAQAMLPAVRDTLREARH